MRPLNNSVIPGFGAKHSDIGSPEYAERVAKPIMGRSYTSHTYHNGQYDGGAS
jgi:hypothetical protein